MELSEFERRVIDVMITGDPEEVVLREQLRVATVSARDYTGVGVFVKLDISESVMRTEMTNRFIQTTPMAFLSHPKLPRGAQAMLWFDQALMNTLECMTFDGHDWPKDESNFVAEPYGPIVTNDA